MAIIVATVAVMPGLIRSPGDGGTVAPIGHDM